MLQINYLKQELIESINNTFDGLKSEASKDILIFELSILYRYNIWGKEAEKVQNITSRLCDNIDEILKEGHANCLQEIMEVIDEINTRLKRSRNNLKLLPQT